MSADVDVRSSTGRWLEDTTAAIARLASIAKRAEEEQAAPSSHAALSAGRDAEPQSPEDGGALPAGPGTVAFPPAAPSAPVSSPGHSSEPHGAFPQVDMPVPGGARDKRHQLGKGFTVADTRDAYLEKVGRCLEHMRAGDSYEMCLTTRLRAMRSVEPLAFFRRLRQVNLPPHTRISNHQIPPHTRISNHHIPHPRPSTIKP